MMELPPYAKSLDISYAPSAMQLAGQAPIVTMPFATKVSGRPGFLHGGAISGLLEMAAVAAVSQKLGEADFDGQPRIKQVNATIDFMRGGTEQDSFAQGRVTRMGRRLANVSVQIWQDNPDKVIAQGHMHYLISAA